MHTFITKSSTDDYVWSYLTPVVTVLKIPLRFFGLLDTNSFRPTRRLERITYAVVLIFFSIKLFQLVNESKSVEIGHFNATFSLFLVYTVMFITNEVEWLRVRSNLGDNIYRISNAIKELDRQKFNLEDRMNPSNKNDINVANDPYKPQPTLIDLIIRGGIAVAAGIVKIGGVKIHNSEFGNASQWYKSLWKEITLEIDSRSDQVIYALTRCYEAAVVIFHDRERNSSDCCEQCGSACICKRKNSS